MQNGKVDHGPPSKETAVLCGAGGADMEMNGLGCPCKLRAVVTRRTEEGPLVGQRKEGKSRKLLEDLTNMVLKDQWEFTAE